MIGSKPITNRLIAGIYSIFFFVSTVLVIDICGAEQRSCTPGLIPEVLVYSELFADEIGTKQYAVVVDKGEQAMHVFDFQGQWRLMDIWPCSTGKIDGQKQKEGDFKTPEGIYFAVRHVSDRFLSDTYGAYALPLDYPNWIDRMVNRTGSGIWLHGTDKALRARDSNGCVVLENKYIMALASMVQLQQTPIIIVQQMQWWSQQQADLRAAGLMEMVARWQTDLMGGSYDRYKRWYAPGAVATMKWWHRWCRIRHSRSRQVGRGQSVARNFDILKCDDTFLIQFDQSLEASGSYADVGHRRLYVKPLEGKLCIVGDLYFRPQNDKDYKAGPDPLFAAWNKLNTQVSKRLPEASQRAHNKES